MRASSTSLARIGLGCMVAGPLLSACGHDQIGRIQGDDSIQGNDSSGGRIEAGSGGDADQDDSGGGGNRVDGQGGSNTGGNATDEDPDPTKPPPCLSREGLERQKIAPYPGTTTLTRDKVWVLDDFTLVREGEVLTIESARASKHLVLLC